MKISKIKQLIDNGNEILFYKSRQWLALREEVLREHFYECQYCAEKGRYTRATMVHHVNELKSRPDLALSKYYTDKNGKRQKQLVPLCFACHEKQHDRFAEYRKTDEKFTNEERW